MKLLHYGSPGRATGAPPGVGMGMGIKPEAEYLKPGDVITLGIDRLGCQRQAVAAWKEAA